MGKAVGGSFQSRNVISSLACLRIVKEDSPTAWVIKWARNPEVARRGGSPRDLVEGSFWEESGSPAFDSS